MAGQMVQMTAGQKAVQMVELMAVEMAAMMAGYSDTLLVALSVY
jgi:hypothetical protein